MDAALIEVMSEVIKVRISIVIIHDRWWFLLRGEQWRVGMQEK
jgi:hypothetical protein